jgi:hypothetical protein
MLWDVFRRNGYVTAFFEDQLNASTFHLDGRGFRFKPTDHYARPFYVRRHEMGLKERRCYHNLTSNMVSKANGMIRL